MRKGPSAARGGDPGVGDGRGDVASSIEARRANGSVLVGRGAAADPIVVALVRPMAPVAAGVVEDGASRPLRPKALFRDPGGTGFGGRSERARRRSARLSRRASTGRSWGSWCRRLADLVTRRSMIGIEGRLQLVRGATPYHSSDPR